MRERITPTSDDMPEIVIQYDKDRGPVGIGLEPRTTVPSQHFVDAIYGDVPTQTKIGKIFWESKSKTVGDTMFNALDFRDAESEADFYNTLGRAILDAVTGSSSTAALWTWFDRPAVNRMVRILRKARDITFGKDE